MQYFTFIQTKFSWDMLYSQLFYRSSAIQAILYRSIEVHLRFTLQLFNQNSARIPVCFTVSYDMEVQQYSCSTKVQLGYTLQFNRSSAKYTLQLFNKNSARKYRMYFTLNRCSSQFSQDILYTLQLFKQSSAKIYMAYFTVVQTQFSQDICCFAIYPSYRMIEI